MIALLMVVALIFASLSLKQLNHSQLRQLKLDKTRLVLSEAKQALLAYSTETLAETNCFLNCPRPGDLPCPDLNNDGEAESSCNTQNSRLGRLPWKTLGLNDLKDGDGESLWYAVSNRYKNNPRVLPLNSDTLGTITMRNSTGQSLYDASNGTGIAAIVIAPHAAILRQDGLQQIRSDENRSNPMHYLDVAFNEDNADFIDDQTNGFIMGEVLQNNRIIVNDIALPITNSQIQTHIQKRVLSEVMQAMLVFYCNGNVQVATRSCQTGLGNYFPSPADMNDSSCLGNASLNPSDCLSDDTQLLGRIPSAQSDPNDAALQQPIWQSIDTNSILQGTDANHNWFQQNGWRELVLYAAAPACSAVTTGCSGSGFLTLTNSLTPNDSPTDVGKGVILMSANKTIHSQTRSSINDKHVLSNYLEGDNAVPSNMTYNRALPNSNQNDLMLSIP